MEEDIKRINCLIERCKQCKLNECITCDICWSEVQAIENLINRNKELEKENEILKKDFTDLCKLKNVIPKSKIKEKIEELKYQTLYIDGITDKKETEIASVGSLMGKIQVLQELLED